MPLRAGLDVRERLLREGANDGSDASEAGEEGTE